MRRAFLTIMGICALTGAGFPGRAQETTLQLTLPHRSNLVAPLSKPTAPAMLTIPAETEVSIQLLSGIHTEVNQLNDYVQASLVHPVYVNGRVALPTGTMLDGRITRIQMAGHLHRAAELAFRFERVTLPDGQATPISASIAGVDRPLGSTLRLDNEGHFKGGRGISWKDLLPTVGGFGVLATLKATAAKSVSFTPWFALGSAALVGYEVLWPRGGDVNLPPDTHCLIRLNTPVTVRVPS
jgi:hypothetical protein